MFSRIKRQVAASNCAVEAAYKDGASYWYRLNDDTTMVRTANCITTDHFSAFEPGLVAPFLTLRDKNGWVGAKTARNLNTGVSRNRFCDVLADPDSRSFSRFGAIIMQVGQRFVHSCFLRLSRAYLCNSLD
jgi:hypothetical protein